jgi:S1-C subfamily serine protease
VQSALLISKGRTGTVFFITDDGYLISNYHVVKDAMKVRLLTGAGLIDAKVVQVDERGNVIGIVSAKLDASAALAASGSLPENVNYAVKSSFLLGFLESVPAVSAKLKAPITADRKFEEVVKSAQAAAVLVLVY